jgi:hypothetical protein
MELKVVGMCLWWQRHTRRVDWIQMCGEHNWGTYPPAWSRKGLVCWQRVHSSLIKDSIALSYWRDSILFLNQWRWTILNFEIRRCLDHLFVSPVVVLWSECKACSGNTFQRISGDSNTKSTKRHVLDSIVYEHQFTLSEVNRASLLHYRL